MTQKEQRLKDIGILDFVLVELTLYLDTHPCDRNALEYFNHYSKIKMKMEKEFSQMYFPLKKDLAESDKEWRWGTAPSPWEAAFPMEDNCNLTNKGRSNNRDSAECKCAMNRYPRENKCSREGVCN